MEHALDDVPTDDTIHGSLADAARLCLRDALTAGDDRAAALHLLAADALLTYACEAAVEDEPAGFAELAAAFAPERLAHLTERHGPQ